jgi:hypothetical protein
MITCTGYNPAAGRSVDEYRKLDAGDESLARWKASLGLDSASGGDKSGPKVALVLLTRSLLSFILHLAHRSGPGADLPYTS